MAQEWANLFYFGDTIMTGNALPTNAGASMISAIPQLLQLFTGTGKVTSNVSSIKSGSTDPRAIGALANIIKQPGPDTSAAVQNAIDLMMRAGVPQIGVNERGTGLFNYSGTKEAMNQLQSTAAAKAAELDLQQKNTNTANKMAAAGKLGDLQMVSTDSQTQSSKQAGTLDPLMTALTLGGLVLGNNLLGGLTGSGSKGKKGEGFVNNNVDVSSALSSGDFSFTPVTHGIDAGDLFSTTLGNFANDVAGGLKSATFDPATGTQQAGGWQDLTGVLSNVASQSGLSMLGTWLSDAFTGLFGGDK